VVYHQLTQLGRTDSSVDKAKVTTVQIFPEAWAGKAFSMYPISMPLLGIQKNKPPTQTHTDNGRLPAGGKNLPIRLTAHTGGNPINGINHTIYTQKR